MFVSHMTHHLVTYVPEESRLVADLPGKVAVSSQILQTCEQFYVSRTATAILSMLVHTRSHSSAISITQKHVNTALIITFLFNENI